MRPCSAVQCKCCTVQAGADRQRRLGRRSSLLQLGCGLQGGGRRAACCRRLPQDAPDCRTPLQPALAMLLPAAADCSRVLQAAAQALAGNTCCSAPGRPPGGPSPALSPPPVAMAVVVAMAGMIRPAINFACSVLGGPGGGCGDGVWVAQRKGREQGSKEGRQEHGIDHGSGLGKLAGEPASAGAEEGAARGGGAAGEGARGGGAARRAAADRPCLPPPDTCPFPTLHCVSPTPPHPPSLTDAGRGAAVQRHPKPCPPPTCQPAAAAAGTGSRPQAPRSSLPSCSWTFAFSPGCTCSLPLF